MNEEDKVSILMVDDQPAKLLSYEAILSDLGENLIKANSGREALELLLKNDVAVVLMDVSMPELDGFELADIIRQHPRFQRTAILFISGVHMSDLDRLKGYQRGAVDYISVPVIPELLKAKVSVFAELHRKTQQLEALNRELRALSGRILSLQDDERRRLERNLHDGAQQHLVALKVKIGLAETFAARDTEKARATLHQLLSDTDEALRTLRELAHGIYPPLLAERGLPAALKAQARRATVSVSVLGDGLGRYTQDVEAAVYFCCLEALQNVQKYADAHEARIELCEEGGMLRFEVTDDGRGFDVTHTTPGSGLVNMRDRLEALEGSLAVTSHPGEGTRVTGVLPVRTVAR